MSKEKYRYTEDVLNDLEGSIILVGNGAYDLTPYGIDYVGYYADQIDSYDNVIRFNMFDKNPKYLPYAGEKVTHWAVAFNNKIYDKFCKLPALTPYRKDFYTESKGLRSEMFEIFSRNIKADKYFAQKDYYHNTLVTKPTTGFMVVRMLLDLGKKFDVVLFDGLKTKHYFYDGRVPYKGHVDADKEIQFLIDHEDINVIDYERVSKVLYGV